MAIQARIVNALRTSKHAAMAWLAVFALLVQAFAPHSMAFAASSSSPIEVQVICTSHGVMTVVVDQDGQPLEMSDIATCPFCVSHASVAVMPMLGASVDVRIEMIERRFARPTSDQHVSPWRAQPRPPRGPPTSI